MNYILELIPTYIKGGVVLCIYLGCLWLFIWKMKTEKRVMAFAIRFLMGEYLITLFSITVSPMYGFTFPKISGIVNLVPFKVLATVETNPMNCFGNVFLFVPLGFFIVFLSKKYWKLRSILIGMYVSVLIEVIQLFNHRGTDVDDVILNTIGYCIGWLLGILSIKVFSILSFGIINDCKNGQKRSSCLLSGAGLMIVLSLGIVMIIGFSNLREFEEVRILYNNC